MRDWQSGQTLEEGSGHSDAEQTGGTVRGTDRQWTDSRRQQFMFLYS